MSEISFERISISSGSVSLQAILSIPKHTIKNAIAIIAHPWGSLGGSMDDHVVRTLNSTFLSQPYSIPTIIYNSRGVGSSTGKASWTGDPEKEDFQRVVEWGIHWSERDSTSRGTEEQSEAQGEKRMMTVYCCGYSYGSLVAPAAHRPSDYSAGSITFRYILISPPIGVSWFLTPFRSRSFIESIKDVLSDNSSTPTVLVIYGDQDNFTSVDNYEKWLKELEGEEAKTSSSLKVVKVEGGSHFWSTTHLQTLLQEVQFYIATT